MLPEFESRRLYDRVGLVGRVLVERWNNTLCALHTKFSTKNNIGVLGRKGVLGWTFPLVRVHHSRLVCTRLWQFTLEILSKTQPEDSNTSGIFLRISGKSSAVLFSCSIMAHVNYTALRARWMLAWWQKGKFLAIVLRYICNYLVKDCAGHR